MLNNFVAEAYQHQDRYRLEYIQEYLDTVKNGTEHARIEALEQIERTLLRIHNTHAIAYVSQDVGLHRRITCCDSLVYINVQIILSSGCR